MHRANARIIAALFLAACSSEPPGAATPGARIAVEVAPLELGGVFGARYRIEVANADDRPVWSEVVTSAAYGDGRGSLSYIGPCDAAASPNAVTLTLEALFDQGGDVIDPQSWRNPTPVTRVVPCDENRDTEVRFDLVVARDAEQGFFDVAVSFDDIFCSAKVDCLASLLHNGAERDTTVVVAFACASGDGSPTWLHMSAIEVVCDGVTHTLVPLGDPGNRGALPPHIFQWASYRDREQLQPFDKCFWNTAIGLDLSAGGDCRLHAVATATDAPLTAGLLPDERVYPFITFDLALSDDGVLTCGAHALDAGGEVATGYVRTTRPSFEFSMRCADAPEVTGTAIACEGGDDGVVFAPTDGGIRVSADGATPVTYALPDGYALQGCCADPCCAN